MNASRWRLALRLLLRDWRAGELTVLIAALLIAVSAMTGVAFLTDRVGQAVELRAAESLAADLRLRSTGPIDVETMEFARSNGTRAARVTSMPSVVFSGEANTLAAVRAGRVFGPGAAGVRLWAVVTFFGRGFARRR